MSRPSSQNLQANKPAPPPARPTVPAASPEEPQSRWAWIALLLWFVAFLGLTLTVWFDFIYGLFWR